MRRVAAFALLCTSWILIFSVGWKWAEISDSLGVFKQHGTLYYKQLYDTAMNYTQVLMLRAEEMEAPPAPRAPWAPRSPRAPRAPRAPKAPRAPPAPGAPGAPDAPGAPPASAAVETPRSSRRVPLPPGVFPLGQGGGDNSTWTQSLAQVAAPGDVLVYTWTNHAMSDFLYNFLVNLKRLGITQFVIGALDSQTAAFCRQKAVVLDMAIPVLFLDAGLPSDEFGWNGPAFKMMAKYKFESVVQMLQAGYGVFVSDTDVNFIQNPLLDLSRYPEPDILVSTDALNRAPQQQLVHSAMNIGIMEFRARPVVAEFVRSFYNTMVNDAGFGKTLWDQDLFNQMARKKMNEGALKIEVLDPVQYCNGQVMFSQQLPRRLNLTGVAVHCTFQFSAAAGKRHRLREFQFWLADELDYYDVPVLTYSHHPSYELIMNSTRSIEDHFNLVNFQLAGFREAWGIAQALGRKLVMNPFMSGFDRTWFPAFTSSQNMFPGSNSITVGNPLVVPADHILNLEKMNADGSLQSLREYSFMTNPKLPQRMHTDVAHISFDTPTGIQTGLKSAELKERLKKYERTSVLHFTSMPANAFGGFSESGEQDKFVDLIKHAGSIFCCEVGKTHAHYDLQWDKQPHTDKHGRVFEQWKVMYGP
jgi:hypothetical protein